MAAHADPSSVHSDWFETVPEETEQLENPSTLGRGNTYPIGMRQSRALLFSIILELISPGLLALLRDIVSTLSTRKIWICYQCFHSLFVANAQLRLIKTQYLDNIFSYYPIEMQWIIKNGLRQKLFSHQYKNYHKMKTDCWIKLVRVSLRTGYQCQQLISLASTARKESLKILALLSWNVTKNRRS